MEKKNFKPFSRAQFSELRNGINGVGVFRYDTICKPKFRINRITGLEIVREDHNFTQTDTPRPILKVLFFFENAETRLIKDTGTPHILSRVYCSIS